MDPCCAWFVKALRLLVVASVVPWNIAISGADIAAVPSGRDVDFVQAHMGWHGRDEQDRAANIIFLHHLGPVFWAWRDGAQVQNFCRDFAWAERTGTDAKMAVFVVDAFVHGIQRRFCRRVSNTGYAANLLAGHR